MKLFMYKVMNGKYLLMNSLMLRVNVVMKKIKGKL